MPDISGDQNLPLLIGETSRSIVALFDAALREMDLTAARARVLLFLARGDRPVGQAEVTANLRVEGPTAVRILDGLEALGTVRRLPDPDDRRAKLVELTDAGRPDAERVVELSRHITGALLDGLTPEQVEGARQVLSRILFNVELASTSVERLAAREALPA